MIKCLVVLKSVNTKPTPPKAQSWQRPSLVHIINTEVTHIPYTRCCCSFRPYTTHLFNRCINKPFQEHVCCDTYWKRHHIAHACQQAIYRFAVLNKTLYYVHALFNPIHVVALKQFVIMNMLPWPLAHAWDAGAASTWTRTCNCNETRNWDLFENANNTREPCFVVSYMRVNCNTEWGELHIAQQHSHTLHMSHAKTSVRANRWLKRAQSRCRTHSPSSVTRDFDTGEFVNTGIVENNELEIAEI